VIRPLLIALFLAAPAFAADDVKSALAEVETLQSQQRYDAILERLKPFESRPTAAVAFQIAWARYLLAIDGHRPGNVDADAMAVAAEWAERARGLGSVEALNLLYLIYNEGAGVPADRTRALAYLRQGVQKGDAGAKANYAVMLYRGAPGVPRDRDLAGRIFRELAAGKVTIPAVYYYLGVMKFRGEGGTKKDPKAAMFLIKLAADRGDREAQRDMGKGCEFGWGGSEDLHQALEWYQKSADNGDGDAQWRIGMAYVNGEERKADPAQAVEWFRRAAESGSTQGMTSLAVMYATGEGVQQDWDRARELYEEAAEGGEAHALLNLSGMYLRGEGVSVDPVHGFVLLSRAAQLGDEQAVSLVPMVAKELTAEQIAEARRRLNEIAQ
jgi:TPR repeat protein